MKAFKIAVAVVLCALVAANALAAESVTRASGGSVQTKDEDFVFTNRGSSLEREWITVHDDSIPADIPGTIGVRTIYDSDDSAPQYRAEYSIESKEELSAVEVRFLLFDIWGEPTRNLSTTDVMDVSAWVTFDATWRASWNEVRDHYASIAYIARVRTKSGRVIEANIKTVLKEARKFSKKFSESDLEPQPPKE